MLRYGSRSFNFSLSKIEKIIFLVRYGSRQIVFLTQNPCQWCGIFYNDRWSVAVRYYALRKSDNYRLPSVP
jgi:hypothetical protein